MFAKTVSFDSEVYNWLDAMSKEKGISLSALVHQIVSKYKKMMPEIKKQEELRKLREATSILFKECDIPKEVVLRWVEVELGVER